VNGEAEQSVRLATGVQEAGLAGMIAELIRTNLQKSPGKLPGFARLGSLISLEAVDAEVTVTLEFARGSLIVYEGIHGAPALRISASSEALLGLAAVKIKLGLPFLFGREGSALRRGLLGGQVKIKGALHKPLQLIRFTRLMSVNA
jgi:hypothetical protein